jgi:hypothetical protein
LAAWRRGGLAEAARAGSPAALTVVAATDVLGAASLQHGQGAAGAGLLILALLLWLVLLPPVLAAWRTPTVGMSLGQALYVFVLIRLDLGQLRTRRGDHRVSATAIGAHEAVFTGTVNPSATKSMIGAISQQEIVGQLPDRWQGLLTDVLSSWQGPLPSVGGCCATRST